MANIKITDLTAYTDPAATDVLPIVDVTTDTTKKVAVGEVVGKITGDVDVATDGTSSIAAGAIVNADVNASAAIAGTKIAPDFGSQTIETTGVINNGGIQFNGDTAAANTLDDYEEGIFTVTVADAVSGGSTGNSSTGRYTKIGRTVTVNGSMFSINTTGLAAGNIVYFQGLPFSPQTHSAVGSITIENITFSGFVVAQCGPSGTAFRLAQSSSGSGEAYLPVSALAAGADIVAFQLSYYAAD